MSATITAEVAGRELFDELRQLVGRHDGAATEDELAAVCDELTTALRRVRGRLSRLTKRRVKQEAEQRDTSSAPTTTAKPEQPPAERADLATPSAAKKPPPTPGRNPVVTPSRVPPPPHPPPHPPPPPRRPSSGWRRALGATVAVLVVVAVVLLVLAGCTATAPPAGAAQSGWNYGQFSRMFERAAGQYWVDGQPAGQWAWQPQSSTESWISWGDADSWPPDAHEVFQRDGDWVYRVGRQDGDVFWRIVVEREQIGERYCENMVDLPVDDAGRQRYVQWDIPTGYYCMITEGQLVPEVGGVVQGPGYKFRHQQTWVPPFTCRNQFHGDRPCIRHWEVWSDRDPSHGDLPADGSLVERLNGNEYLANGMAFVVDRDGTWRADREPWAWRFTEPQAARQFQRIAIVGDSMSTGYGVPDGSSYVDHLDARLAGEVRAYAVNGATALRHLVEYPEVAEPIGQWNPELIIVSLGGNEYYIGRSLDYYRETMSELTDRLEQLAPNAQLAFVHYYDIDAGPAYDVCDVDGYCTPDRQDDPRQPWAEYGTAMHAVADQQAGEYVDIAAQTQDPAYRHADGVHLNETGHRVYADALAPSLVE